MRLVALGKALIARIISPCLKTVALQFVVEDPDGAVAMANLHNFHIGDSRCYGESLDDLWAVGNILGELVFSLRG